MFYGTHQYDTEKAGQLASKQGSQTDAGQKGQKSGCPVKIGTSGNPIYECNKIHK